jgi:CarD family transcriptional regulator
LSFKVGDKVVYPNHGVGVIEQVARRAVGDIESSFYCLRILSTDSTVMVPVDNTAAVGLRKILTRREVSRVVKALKDSEVTTYDDWKGRFQANSEKMRTGDIKAVAEVLKNLVRACGGRRQGIRDRGQADRRRSGRRAGEHPDQGRALTASPPVRQQDTIHEARHQTPGFLL